MFTKLIQAGFLTGQLDRMLDDFVNIYRIGPWNVLKYSSENVKSMSVYGKKRNYSMNVAVCPIGGIRFEYIEPITSSIFSDYYNIYGENTVHHLKLGVDSYREALRFFESKGIKTIQVGHQHGDEGKNMFNFLDTLEDFAFITEIVYVTRNFIKPRPDVWYPSEDFNQEPVFLKPSVVGIVVRNIDEKISKYEKFNFGPWLVKDFGNDSSMDIKAKMAFYRLENVIFKLIEPKSDSIFSAFLSEFGEGVHHIKMEVNDYEGTLKYLNSKGIKAVYTGNYMDKVNFTFLDTTKHFHFFTEISDSKITDQPHTLIDMHP